MMKSVVLFLIIFLNYKYAIGRNIGETEITTDDGIEVFQEEKYYLLKKNVEIVSDEFELKGDLVKIYFEKDLYDIQNLVASTDVNFNSNAYNISGKGEMLEFNIKNEDSIKIKLDEEIMYQQLKMKIPIQDEFIKNKIKFIENFIKQRKLKVEFEIINFEKNLASKILQ